MLDQPPGPLPGLSAVSARYDGILCDVWGVIHNGVTAYPRAAEALMRYRAGGGRVVLITNAPRPSSRVRAMLGRLGVPDAAFDAVVSSGDTTRELIAPYGGTIIHHVGPATYDDSLYEGLNVAKGPAEKAAAVVVTDLEDEDDTVETYAERMADWLERELPLICANPDKVVEVGGRLVYCAGALADAYEAMGGLVKVAGKPYRAIYDVAMALLERAAGKAMPIERVLAIGDSVRTDAVGAAAFGMDLLFISSSVHGAELGPRDAPDPDRVAALVAPSGAKMVGFMPDLVW